MLEKYKAMMDGAKAAVEAADEIHASAASVKASLEGHHEAIQRMRVTITETSKTRAAAIMEEAREINERLSVLQSDIDAMIAQIEGPAEKPAVEQFAEATS